MNSSHNQALQALMIKIEALKQEVYATQAQYMGQPHFSQQPNPYNNWGCVQPTENMQNWNMGSPFGTPAPGPGMDFYMFMGPHRLMLPAQNAFGDGPGGYKVYAINISSEDEIPEEAPGSGITQFFLESHSRKTMLIFVSDRVLLDRESHKEFKEKYWSKPEKVASMILSLKSNGNAHAGKPVPVVTMSLNYGFSGTMPLSLEIIIPWLEDNREVVTAWLDVALTAAKK